MSRRGWIALLLVVGVGLAVVLGAFARSQTRAERQLCDSLSSLSSDVQSLANTPASSMSKDSLQSQMSTIEGDWSDVKSDAKDVADFDKDNIKDAWSTFTDAIQAIPGDSSPQDMQSAAKSAADTFESSVKATIGDLDCSS